MLRAFIPCSRLALAALISAAPLAIGLPAQAQVSGCEQGQKLFSERQSLVQRLNALSKGKKVDPRNACSLFTRLAGNGDASMKWVEANKDWCQIPDQVAEGLKEDHQRIADLRGKACQAAAQLTAMEKKARQAQREGGGGLLGGGGLTGDYKIPQGAL